MSMPIANTIHRLFLQADDQVPAYIVHIAGPSLSASAAIAGSSMSGHDDHVTILVCAQQPDAALLQCLGAKTVWMASSGSAQQDLQLLRQALLDPVQRPGLYSVDLADYRMALGRGGRIVVHTSVAANPRLAIDQFPDSLGCPLALCLHLYLPMTGGMPEIDQAVWALESIAGVMANDPPLVLAAHCEDRADIRAVLLVVYAKDDVAS